MFNHKSARYFLITGVLFAIISGFSNKTHASAEVINNFEAKIEINKDSSVLVSEKINYDFGDNQRHGIFRDIPLSAENGPQLDIDILGVFDESGRDYPYDRYTRKNVLNIKIGNPNLTISGKKAYVIKYLVRNAIRTFSDHDELYWNVTGNQWLVPIDKASAFVTLFDPSLKDPRMACFTGPVKSVLSKCVFSKVSGGFDYTTTDNLKTKEGLTIVFSMPSGYVKVADIKSIDTTPVKPTPYNIDIGGDRYIAGSRMFDLLVPFVMVFIFIVSVVVIILSLHGPIRIKPKPSIPKELRGLPIVVEYNPPDNLPPIEVGTLLDRRVDVTDISSVIMDLAVHGYLKIKHISVKSFLSNQDDFELIRLKSGEDLNHPADKIIFDLFFKHNDRISLSKFKGSGTVFQNHIEKIIDETEKRMSDEGYFDQPANDKTKKPENYLVILGLIIGAVSAGVIFGGVGLAAYSSLVVIIIFITELMKLGHRITPRGVAAFAKVLGFREFLQLTEKDKLELLDAPELRPETFEKFLPYAMALGVEDKWAKKFESIYNTIPSWYEDPTMSTFNSFTLINNLTYFDTAFNGVFNITSPRSSFSSGFSGGSSGGGSGGGGGGSW